MAVFMTVPAVGGYSTTGSGQTRKTPRACETASAGIVSFLKGEAYLRGALSEKAHDLFPGTPIECGDMVIVEIGSTLRIADGKGGHLTAAGPAQFKFAPFPVLYSGTFRVTMPSFFHAGLAGGVAGDALIWVSRQEVQAMNVAGALSVWHPELAQERVEVPPGMYSQASIGSRQLQPLRPAKPNPAKLAAVWARFRESGEDFEKSPSEAPSSPHQVGDRKIAAETAEKPVAPPSRFLGTRTARELVAPKNEEDLEALQARISGKDFEESDDGEALAVAGPRRDAYGNALPAHGRSPASSGLEEENDDGKPRIEIASVGKKRSAEQRRILEKLRKHSR